MSDYGGQGLAQETDLQRGSRGNPYPFDTIADLLVFNGSFTVGNFVETLGETTKFDGSGALYIIVATGDVGIADGSSIIDLANNKAFRLYSNGDTTMTDSVYDVNFPNDELEENEMLDLAANNSIGIGGASWWTRPISIGRSEGGIDVVYKGDSHGSPENRQLVLPAGTDPTLEINKRLGEAVIKLTRLELGTTTKFSAVGLNDKQISYREDEHHTPAVWPNNTGGNIITSFGSRNSARTQEGEDVSNVNYITYGQSSDSLAESEAVTFVTTADYAQGFFVGNTSYYFSRENIGNWTYVRMSGGQNAQTPVQFFDAEDDQFYMCISAIDKTILAIDPLSSTDNTKVHFFGASHPTFSPDGKIYYATATFFPADVAPSPRDAGGLYLTKVDGTTSVGGINGKMDSTFTPFKKADMDVAYTAPGGSSLRMLDVQYGDTPRCIFAEFVLDWNHGASIPYGKEYDIKMTTWNGSAWVTLTIATALRGMLGYKPQSPGFDENLASTGVTGVEGFTSAYVLGASFYRGADRDDLDPIVYYCSRAGDAKIDHSLTEVTLASDYLSVSSTAVLIANSENILYRPEMALYGNKRILWFNDAQGWSSFNSWTSETKWLDRT